MTTFAQPPITFRRDRFGECWHLIPAGGLGARSRTVCGQPRQGTPLSETYTEVQPEAGIQQPPRPSAHWLPAVLTSSDALDDPQGWSQRALTADAGTTGANVLQLAVGNPSPDERQQAQAFKQHTLQRSVGRVRPFALPANSYTRAWPTVGKATAFV